MKTDIITNYTKIVADLKENNRITVLKHTEQLLPLHEKTKERFQRLMKQKLGYILSGELLEYVDISNGLQLYWTYDLSDKNKGGGEFKLISLFEVFLFERPPLWSDIMKQEEIDLLKKFKTFDEQPLSGNGRLTAFVTDDTSPSIFFYDRGEVYRMQINYAQYISEMLALKGIGGWQYFFCEITDDSLKKYLKDYLTKKIQQLQILFPTEDLNKYQDILLKFE